MPQVSPHIIEFLRWVCERPRTYSDVMEAWRTNCPRHSVWEDSLIDGLVEIADTSNEAAVSLTEMGMASIGLISDEPADRLGRARLSLEGLSLGDAFGECFMDSATHGLIRRQILPEGPWFYTDDTMMALGIVEVLEEKEGIDQDLLAKRFAARFHEQPNRCYGRAAISMLERIQLGFDWRSESRRLFDGAGSMGNGAAMRVAPLGAYFADDYERVVAETRASAEVTHAHPDGQAGAIAVAIAAACALRSRSHLDSRGEILLRAFELTPIGPTRDGIAAAGEIGAEVSPEVAARQLGSGQRLLSSDTVPFAIWCAATFLDDYEKALWATASGFGDVDTTCAMVGGIVALAVGGEGLPKEWLRRREPIEE